MEVRAEPEVERLGRIAAGRRTLAADLLVEPRQIRIAGTELGAMTGDRLATRRLVPP